MEVQSRELRYFGH